MTLTWYHTFPSAAVTCPVTVSAVSFGISWARICPSEEAWSRIILPSPETVALTGFTAITSAGAAVPPSPSPAGGVSPPPPSETSTRSERIYPFVSFTCTWYQVNPSEPCTWFRTVSTFPFSTPPTCVLEVLASCRILAPLGEVTFIWVSAWPVIPIIRKPALNIHIVTISANIPLRSRPLHSFVSLIKYRTFP